MQLPKPALPLLCPATRHGATLTAALLARGKLDRAEIAASMRVRRDLAFFLLQTVGWMS